MVIYMKGRRGKMHWRRHVAIICVVLLFLLVNKFLFTSWHDTEEKTAEVPYLPTDKLGVKEKYQQGLENDPVSTKDKAVYRISNTREKVKDGINIHRDKVDNGNAVKKAIVGGLGNYAMYLKDFEESEIQNKFINKHEYAFGLNNKNACNGNVYVVILIHSAPNKLEERQMIRNTWGSVRYYKGATIAPLFLLGLVGEEDANVQENLENESRKYRDIIQGNFVDSYRNLTTKNVMGLHWLQHYCNHTKFILKTDDDTMVNIYHLIKFLFQKSPDGDLNNFLYCSTYKNQGPRRDKLDKWYVTFEEYKYSKYPPYCEGFAYIMSFDVSKKLYGASGVVKPYWIDDVFVTGFLVLKAGIYHKDMEHGHGYSLMKSEHISRTVQSSMFILAKYNHMRDYWDRTWSDIKIVNKIFK